MSAVPVDFDGDGTDKYAASILCGEGPEAGGRMVVGFRRVNDVFQSIGRIVGTQDGIQTMELMRPKGNAIEVLVSAEYSDGAQRFVPSQWRTYALRGSGFRQVAGQVTFPANPPAIRLTVQPRQVVLRKTGDVRTGTVQFAVTNVGNLATPVVGVHIALPESFPSAGADWSGCAVEIPGVYVCRLPGLKAGETLDRSMEVLAPVQPASALSTQESVPLNLLYP